MPTYQIKNLKYFLEINKQKEINDINEIGRGEIESHR